MSILFYLFRLLRYLAVIAFSGLCLTTTCYANTYASVVIENTTGEDIQYLSLVHKYSDVYTHSKEWTKMAYQWGNNLHNSVAGGFNGDGLDDIAVEAGIWYIRYRQ